MANYFVPNSAAVHVFPDGREVCNPNAAGNREYRRRIQEMAARQDENCAICGRFMVQPTFDHERSRGGGNRDDRTEVDSKPINAAVCYWCNSEKGSRRFHWVNGQYLEVERECFIGSPDVHTDGAEPVRGTTDSAGKDSAVLQ